MHSVFARISSLFSLMGSAMMALMVATCLSTAFIYITIPAEMGVSNVNVQVAEDFTASHPSQNDLGTLRMDFQVLIYFLFSNFIG